MHRNSEPSAHHRRLAIANSLACVASVSIWPGFGAKKDREQKMKEGGEEGAGRKRFCSFLPHPLHALLLAPFFARSLTLVPRSLFLNRTETLATQGTNSYKNSLHFAK